MPEQELLVIKRTLSPYMEIITQKDSWKYKDAICGNVSLDLDKIIFTEQVNPDDKYLKQPYIDLIALDNLNQISDSERHRLKTTIERTCEDIDVDFCSWYQNDMNRESFEGNILRSGDLYLADCFFGELHPNLIFIVPENSEVKTENGTVYIDDSITSLDSCLKDIRDGYIRYIRHKDREDQEINLLTLDTDFEKNKYNLLKEFGNYALIRSQDSPLKNLNIEKIGHVRDIPISSLNNYHPQISMLGCSYARGYAVSPRIMFAKP